MCTVVILLVFAILFYGIFIERNTIEKTYINFSESPRITFAHITDLHFIREGLKHKKLLKILQEEPIDLIFITGDIVSFRRQLAIKDYLRKISSLNKPIYFVFGNWDHKVKDFDNLRNTLRELGIIVLENGSTTFKKDGLTVTIVGVDDPFTGRDNLKLALKDVELSNYTILLTHSPDIFYEASENKIDLVLAGHLHGGQVSLPKIRFAIYSPSKYGVRFLKGLFKLDKTTMYVNRGIGESHLPIRIFSKPEVLIGRI